MSWEVNKLVDLPPKCYVMLHNVMLCLPPKFKTVGSPIFTSVTSPETVAKFGRNVYIQNRG